LRAYDAFFDSPVWISVQAARQYVISSDVMVSVNKMAWFHWVPLYDVQWRVPKRPDGHGGLVSGAK
jgi:hypothetical protein